MPLRICHVAHLRHMKIMQTQHPIFPDAKLVASLPRAEHLKIFSPKTWDHITILKGLCLTHGHGSMLVYYLWYFFLSTLYDFLNISNIINIYIYICCLFVSALY